MKEQAEAVSLSPGGSLYCLIGDCLCKVTVVSYDALFLDAFNRTFGLKGVRVYVRTEFCDTPDRIENCVVLSFIELQL